MSPREPNQRKNTTSRTNNSNTSVLMSFALMGVHQQGPFCPVSFVSSGARGKARRCLQVSGKNRAKPARKTRPREAFVVSIFPVRN
jgi:hypothetical protein